MRPKDDQSVETSAGAFWPAQEGNLPMLQYIEELEPGWHLPGSFD